MKENREEAGRRRTGLRALLFINAALLVGLVFVTFPQFVGAQGFRAAGRYHAVSGSAPGWDAGVIYIIDETNQQLVAVTYDPNARALSGVGARDLALDIAQGRSR